MIKSPPSYVYYPILLSFALASFFAGAVYESMKSMAMKDYQARVSLETLVHYASPDEFLAAIKDFEL